VLIGKARPTMFFAARAAGCGPLPRWRSPELAAGCWGGSAPTVAPGPQAGNLCPARPGFVCALGASFRRLDQRPHRRAPHRALEAYPFGGRPGWGGAAMVGSRPRRGRRLAPRTPMPPRHQRRGIGPGCALGIYGGSDRDGRRVRGGEFPEGGVTQTSREGQGSGSNGTSGLIFCNHASDEAGFRHGASTNQSNRWTSPTCARTRGLAIQSTLFSLYCGPLHVHLLSAALGFRALPGSKGDARTRSTFRH